MAFRRLITGIVAAAITLVVSEFPAFAYPGDLTAGEYDNTTLTAGFGYFNQTDFSNLSVNVTDTTKAFRPVGGAWTSTETRTVQIDFFQPSLGFGGDGCYVLGPGQAAIDRGLGGASLQVKITDQTPACSGSFNSILLPFDVSMTLTGNGPVRSSRGLTRESCLDYSFVLTTTQALNPASGTATVSAFQPGSVAGGFSGLQSLEQTTHVQGPTHDNCPQEPGATPGGIGPPDPGRYQRTSTVANATQFDDSGSLGVTLTVSTDISSPHSGPSTTTTVMQVSFNMYRNGVFAAGCFNVSPSEFSVTGVQSAQVTLDIEDSTPTCYGFPANMPLHQTLHVVWTTSSPVSNFQFQGSFSCLTYHLTGTGSESTANPAASVSLTPLLGDTVITTTNSLTTSSNNTIAAGIKQASCHI